MNFFKLFYALSLASIGFTALLFMTAQWGLLRGSPPDFLGLHEGQLAQPSATPNSVSSQASLHPNHPQASYAAIAPLHPRAGEDGAAALSRLEALLQAPPGVQVVLRQDGYLRAEASTRWLKFVDDLEFAWSPTERVIHLRSASRLGRKDFGVNRSRMERLRSQFEAPR